MSVMRLKLAREPAARDLLFKDYVIQVREAVQGSDLPPGTRVTAGPPLAQGYTSRCEYVDVDVPAPVTTYRVRDAIVPRLPEGVSFLWATRLPANAPGVRAAATGYRYAVRFDADPERAGRFARAETWPFTRIREKGEQAFELKKSVPRLTVQPGQVILEICVYPDGTPKPHEVVASVFGLPLESARELPAERLDVRLSPPPTLGSRD